MTILFIFSQTNNAVALYHPAVTHELDQQPSIDQQVYVDKKNGRASEVETVAIVDLGDGNIGMLAQQRNVGVNQTQAQAEAVTVSIYQHKNCII